MLPAYKVNPMLDLSPISNALTGYQQQMNTNDQLNMQQKRLDMETERFQDQKRDSVRQRLGNVALLTLQEADPTRRAQKWQQVIQTHPEAATLDAKYHDPSVGPMAVLGDAKMAQEYLNYQLQKAAEGRANAQLGLARNADARAAEAERRAAALSVPQLATAKLQYDSAKREFDAPKVGTADIGADHARIFYDSRTGQEISRLQGPPKPPDSTARKAIYEAQDELPNLKAAVDQLNEAKSILPNIYTGFGSQARTTLNQGAPDFLPNLITDPARAKATQRYNQIMSGESISAMSQTLKGATTDREMFEFKSIMNDPNQRPDVKAKALEYMIRKAQAFYQNKVDRIRELGGRMPSDGSAQPQSPAGAADPLGIR